MLRQDPGHPLALNNLAAIMVKKGNYDQALACLKRALPRSRGFKVALNRVCNVDGVCAACRMNEEQFGTEDLEGVVKSNILMVEIAKTPGRGKTGKPAIPVFFLKGTAAVRPAGQDSTGPSAARYNRAAPRAKAQKRLSCLSGNSQK